MKEEEIRPKQIFDEYLDLARNDAFSYFSDCPLTDNNCPACGDKGKFMFEKNSFKYELCSTCQTLFVNPRPSAHAFSKYYTESPSSKYWASTFYEKTAAARIDKLWKPKASLIIEILKKYSSSDLNLVDIGGGFGLFADVFRSLSNKVPVVIEPGPNLAAACRNRCLPVVEKFLEDVVADDLPDGPKAFVSFELFEHLHDPAYFLSQVLSLMKSGDLFIFTTLSGLGLDIQILWESSNAVSPPHHLNFFNPDSIRLLLSNLGLSVLEVSTPGKLDLDILENNKSLIKDRFWSNLLDKASREDKQKWQSIIASTGWSSHMMVVCTKP